MFVLASHPPPPFLSEGWLVGCGERELGGGDHEAWQVGGASLLARRRGFGSMRRRRWEKNGDREKKTADGGRLKRYFAPKGD